ncbi:unnamed protein product [Didymodactylos carnosus]|uniref:Condensin complex subunit 2 n=1 Tax=Didymodactylos carnosus TaxID=1234261 RepID=A0A813WDN0_9BILA|nr:unnamed protein product [Didymodactylos carnosus]CAF1093997.1 unnamed protein product [Didymodactylos carnosus]CAF3642176.1 unnamed protein product [Didymodactylos carnosus]CAF3855468.1 unnamed protein product [Didymodactylos carnosus]
MATLVEPPPPRQCGRRSLHASRRSTRMHLDESLQNPESESPTTVNDNNRRKSRLFNTSFNIDIDEPQKSSSELVALYQKTSELNAQGKITAKNAFEFRFIEYLPQILNNIALEDKKKENGPNFVKAGNVIDTSAKIYACRVDALHNETQKLSGDMLTTDDGNEQCRLLGVDADDGDNNQNQENIEPTKQKIIRRKNATKIIIDDLSKISLTDEFQFRPLQTTSLCRSNTTEQNSIHKEFVAHMYSTSDYATIEGFSITNLNEQENDGKAVNRYQISLEKDYDLKYLRDIIKPYENIDHILGSQKLRSFTFNENRTDSFINTIHESSVADSRLGDEEEDMIADDNNDVIDDIDHKDGFFDENSHDVFMAGMLSDARPEPSTNHGESQSSQSLPMNGNFPPLYDDERLNMPNPPTLPTHFINDDRLSTSSLSSMSFADQLPYLLKLKGDQEYSFFDASKLKLFAGPNVWKYQNLLDGNSKQVIHHQAQAPVTAIKRRLRFDSGESQRSGSNSRRRLQEKCDFFMDGSLNRILGVRSKETSMKRIVLRSREKQSTEIKLARKLVKTTDLSCPTNFPDLIFESFQTMIMNKKQRLEKLNDTDDENDFNMVNDGEHDGDDIDLPAGFVQYDGIQASQDDHVYVVDRPIYYERIEYAKRVQRLDVKQLKREMLDEIHRQSQTINSTDQSSSNNISSISHMNGTSDDNNKPVEFVQVCANLFENQNLHLNMLDLPSAFYCMLINCNENKLYMKNTQGRDDILISRNPFINVQNISTLTTTHSLCQRHFEDERRYIESQRRHRSNHSLSTGHRHTSSTHHSSPKFNSSDLIESIVEKNIDEQKTYRSIVIARTSLNRDQLIQLGRFLQEFNASISSTVDERTTHLITDDENDTLVCTLTKKVFQAVARHLFIVSYRWIDECLKQKVIIKEDNFEITGDSILSTSHRGMQQSRLNHQQPIFSHKKYSIAIHCDDCQNMFDRQELIELIHLSGAIYETNSDNASIILCGEEYVNNLKQLNGKKWRKTNVIYVAPEFLLDSILKYEIQSFTEYEF